jgi:serine phosphatase RsbU (regulator of sigma subunit)
MDRTKADAVTQWDAYCGDMALAVPPVPPACPCAEVFALLNDHPDWPGLAVVDEAGRLLGYFSRRKLLSVLSKPLMVDLYQRRPVELLMETRFMAAQLGDTLDALCERIAQEHRDILAEGLVVVEGDRYVGLGGVAGLLALTVEQAKRRSECLAREKEVVERANHRINDSIRYASRIQGALLPDGQALKGLVHDMAVGWWPRDVVGGDFYWAGRFGSRGLIALMDCTGHGVPGAFMTAIVATQLDRILHEHCYDDPARILGLLNRLVKASLRQEEARPGFDLGSDDGLDAALCLIDPEQGHLIFAGANLPLFYGHGGVVEEIKGDHHSLGYRSSQADYAFTNRQIELHPGDSFYLATDGVSDQVGGPSHRLFGRRRLAEALGLGWGQPMGAQIERLAAHLAGYRDGELPRDDMTIIGVTAVASR